MLPYSSTVTVRARKRCKVSRTSDTVMYLFGGTWMMMGQGKWGEMMVMWGRGGLVAGSVSVWRGSGL